ncbi:MAG TPA: hypothetical protein DDY68_05675, partial [Porphyromonadaceae bacterium]|nr:hypothetical protein [Porphyromonadaceae bacterium]
MPLSVFYQINHRIMNRLSHFIKEWKLPIAMFLGAMGYFILEGLSLGEEEKEMIYHTISQSVEPILIFIMLFLSFLKVRPKEMGFRFWQGKIMIVQSIFFLLFSFIA